MTYRKQVAAAVCGLILIVSGCAPSPAADFTIAVNAGAEGDALKAAVDDYGRAHPGIKMQTVSLPYASLFEKELLEVTFGAGSYDVIMMDDPWFPRLAEHGKLAPLEREPDSDFIPACIAISREPYKTGTLYAL